MYSTQNRGSTTRNFYSAFLVVFVIFASLLFNAQQAEAAGTLAGTTIGNQATARYKDSTGTRFTSSSNLVTTTITPVYGFNLTPNSTDQTSDANAQNTPGQLQNATPGAIVYFPYTLTNSGNSPDSFTLATAIGSASTFTPTGIKIYVDANGNGVIDVGDSLVAGNVGPVAADGQLKLIVQYSVPTGAANATLANVDITAVSVGNGALPIDQRNYNRTTVVNDAVISVVKAVDKATVDPLGDLTYTFTISNTGNNKANPVVITDVIPSNTDFVVGSTVSVANGTFTFSDDSGVTYAYTPVGATDPAVTNVKFTYNDAVNGFPAANTRSVSFKVRVESGAPNVTVPNNGVYDYTPAGSGTPVTDTNTNTVVTQINKKSAAQISFSGSPFGTQTTSGSHVTDPVDDTTTQASAPSGTYIYFKNVITNNGNATDTFNITSSASTFPAGSSVNYFKLTDNSTGSNNTNPLLDTNADSIVDTGTIAAGGNVSIVTRVFIPGNASGGAYTATIQAASTNGGTAKGTTPTTTLTDTTFDTLTSIVVPGVTLRNVINGSPSATTVTMTESSNGTTVSYPLNVNNTGGSNDTFNLTSGTVTGIPGATVAFYQTVTQTTLAADALKDATSITLTDASGFIAGDKITINGQTLTVGSVAGNIVTFSAGQKLFAAIAIASDNTTVVEPGLVPITSTGVLAPAANANVVAVITVPAGADPYSTANNLTFTATSTNDNTKTSTVTDSLIIPSFRDFTLVANRSGSVPAGGVLFYDHTITNNGNASETFNLSVPATGTSGFTYQILDGTTNAVISVSPAIAKGGSYTFKIKVVVPSGTASGTVENALITAEETTSSQSKTNNDTTTVVSGFVSLVKSVVNKGPAGTATNSGSTAIPGDILEYSIQYNNIGSADALEVSIDDQIPANTTYKAGSLVINGNTKTDVGTDDEGATGSADFNISTINGVTFYLGTGATNVLGGTLAPGSSGTVVFRVTVN